MGLANSLGHFLLLHFVGGVSSAFVLVLASTLILEQLSAAGRSNLSAFHFAGVGGVIALSALITWAVAALGGGWGWMWYGGGIFSFAAVLPSRSSYRDSRTISHRRWLSRAQ